MNRIISGVVAGVLSLLSLAFVAPSADGAPGSAAARALPARTITISWNQVRSTSYVKLTGKAQDAPNHRIYLQKKKSGQWRNIRSQKTNDNTAYSFKVKIPHDGNKHAFRTMMKATSTYAKSFSQSVVLHWV